MQPRYWIVVYDHGVESRFPDLAEGITQIVQSIRPERKLVILTQSMDEAQRRAILVQRRFNDCGAIVVLSDVKYANMGELQQDFARVVKLASPFLEPWVIYPSANGLTPELVLGCLASREIRLRMSYIYRELTKPGPRGVAEAYSEMGDTAQLGGGWWHYLDEITRTLVREYFTVFGPAADGTARLDCHQMHTALKSPAVAAL